MKKVVLSLLSLAALSSAALFAPVQTAGKLPCGRIHEYLGNKAGGDFNSIIRNNPNVVVDFYAPWCGPCKKLAPIFDALAKEMSDVVFLKVNVDENGPLANQYGIKGMPTLVLFKNGQKVGATGARSQGELRTYIRSTLQLK